MVVDRDQDRCRPYSAKIVLTPVIVALDGAFLHVIAVALPYRPTHSWKDVRHDVLSLVLSRVRLKFNATAFLRH